MNLLALTGAVLIGLSLGLTGAGGSIFTLPILVYLAGVPPRDAVALSLLVVGAAAGVGAWQRAKAGEFHLRAAVMFAISGAGGAIAGARLTHLVSGETLMLIFAAIMVVVGIRMALTPREGVPSPECRPLRCIVAGGGVGVLTGFLGVGGGFLLMPALVKFARLPIRTATGTSLAVISVNSAAGFFSHVSVSRVSWALALVFSLIAVVGVLAGGKVASRLPERVLRRVFAALVLITAVGILCQSGLCR